MQVVFDNQETINFEFLESPVTDYFRYAYKHLQHIPLNFSEWCLPNKSTNCFSKLIHYANLLNIEIDRSKLNNQQYLNELHKIYEKNYDGTQNWLFYHDHIHLCETKNISPSKQGTGVYQIDWREKAGPLVKKYNQQYTSSLVNKIFTGQLFFKWSELGKSPYNYWRDGEPDNLQRMTELAKPILFIRPQALIACKNIDTLANKNKDQFINWWSGFHDQWCNHWNITEWSFEQMHGVIPYAQTHETTKLQYLAENHHCPIKIKI